MTDEIIKIVSEIPGFYDYFIGYILILARVLSFILIAPVFRRKEVQSMIKVGFSMIIAYIMLQIIDIGTVPTDVPFIFLLFMNVTVGLFLSLITRMIFSTVQAAGDMANNQMALSSASVFDPGSRVQTSIIGRITGMLAIVVFINVGGLYWLISGIERSFTMFPLFDATPALVTQVTLEYWIYVSANIIFIGFQMVAPVIITTLAIDIILGVISKTAPQINVFQLSFVFKPTVGSMVLLATLPLFYRLLETYFLDHALLF
jgi:flagellar biosynthetic protein FliR